MAILLSFITPIYSLSNQINPLGLLLFPHFHITPNQIHKTLSFIPVEIESCRLKISGIFQRKSSLKDSVFLCRTQIFKTRDLCNIIMSSSASRKRVFKPRVLYGTRVSKTRDASLQLSFKRVLTYYIISIYYASPQISP